MFVFVQEYKQEQEGLVTGQMVVDQAESDSFQVIGSEEVAEAQLYEGEADDVREDQQPPIDMQEEDYDEKDD